MRQEIGPPGGTSSVGERAIQVCVNVADRTPDRGSRYSGPDTAPQRLVASVGPHTLAEGTAVAAAPFDGRPVSRRLRAIREANALINARGVKPGRWRITWTGDRPVLETIPQE
jgi:hypothetical protein